MSNVTNSEQLDQLLLALGEQVAAIGASYELVVIGGSGLLALGLVDRATRDVDVLALRKAGELVKSDPLPTELVAAAERVGRDFDVPSDWLNPGPASLLDLGLPEGLADRLQTRQYGSALTVHVIGRVDQIHFKLYATVDQGPGKHEADLRSMRPSAAELEAAARWACTHDPSPGFRTALGDVLRHLGVEDVDLDS